MDGYFYTISGHDFLQKLYDFGYTFVLECLRKENNAFWKDVFYSWSCYIKLLITIQPLKTTF